MNPIKGRNLFIYISISASVFFAGCLQDKNHKSEAEYSSSANEASIIEIDNEEPLFDIELKRDLSIGDSEDHFVRFVGEFSVDEADRVFIAEKNQIIVFDQEGTYLKLLGGKGRGPGEFTNFGGLLPKIGHNKLFAYDDVQLRINVFDLEQLEPEYSIPLIPQNWDQIEGLSGVTFKRFFPAGDSLIIVGFTEVGSPLDRSENISRYYLMNQAGEIISDELFNHVDTGFYSGSGIPAPISLRGHIPMPSDRNSVIDFDDKGRIYWGWTEDIAVNVYDPAGKKIKSLIYPKETVEVNADQMLETYEFNAALHQKAKEMEKPETWPGMDFFFVDDENRIWISTITDSDDYFEWIVVSDTGEYLANFKWRGNRLGRHNSPRELKMVKNNYLYTSELNEETGGREVVRYKIELTER